jgi:transposase
MLTLPPSTRIFLCAPTADMRRSFDGLTALARDVIGEDPLSGHLFVFTNRRRTRLKVLVFDGSGMWVMAKRLERGTFAWPNAKDGAKRIVIHHDELAALLGGLDISRAKRRAWYRRENSSENSRAQSSAARTN